MRSSTDTELEYLRRRMEQLDRHRFADIVSQLPDALCQFDAELRFVYVNEAFERWVGAAATALLGRTPPEAGIAPPLALALIESARRVFETGTPALRNPQLDPAADPRFFEFHFLPQHGAAGQIDQLTVVARSRDRLTSILDSIGGSLLALDCDWHITRVDARLATQLGKAREDLIGRSIWEALPHLPAEVFRTQLESAARDRAPCCFEVRLGSSGRCFEVHAHASANGLSTYWIDITERKAFERQLREAHESFAALVHASPLAIVAFTPGGEITVWNEAAEAVFGWSADEAIGRPLPFIPADKVDEHRLLHAQHLEGASFTGVELRRRRKDGSSVDLSVSSAPIRDVEGAVRGIVAVYEDITERKRVESALRENETRLRKSEEALRLATDSAQVGIWIYDVGLHSLKLSALAAKLIGAGGHEIEIGVRELLDRIHIEDRDMARRQIRDALDQGNEYSSEYRVVWPNGEIHWMAARGLAELDAQGNKVRFSGVISDATERKKTEQELARSNAELQQFAFVTSHDLQEPLRTISAYAQLLSRRFEDKLDDDGREYLTFIVDGATRMQNLINDLLAFSRILHGQTRPLGEVDMETVYAWCVMNLNTAIQESGAVITHDPLPPIAGNQQEILQLLQNLLSNAVKYRGPEPPRIHVGAEEREAEVRFCVRDNGIGIEPAYHQRIFGVFKRLHGKDVPGTGIGLALCQRIVEKHGGRIWVESQAGQGATFYFTLPR